jgi:hypothetical protein
MTHVLVVNVNVDEASQLIGIVVQMTAQIRMQRRQVIQSLAGSGRLNLNAGIAGGKLTQRRGDVYCNWHD